MRYRKRRTKPTFHFSDFNEWNRIEVETRYEPEPVSYGELMPAPRVSLFSRLVSKLPLAEAAFFLFGYYLYKTEGMILMAFCWYISYRCLFPFKPREIFILNSLQMKGSFRANGYKIHAINWDGVPILAAIYRPGVENLLYHLAVTYRVPAAVILRPGDKIHSPVPLVHYKVLDFERVVRSWQDLNPHWSRIAPLVKGKRVRIDTVVIGNPKYYMEVPSRRNIGKAILAFALGCIMMG